MENTLLRVMSYRSGIRLPNGSVRWSLDQAVVKCIFVADWLKTIGLHKLYSVFEGV